MIEDPFPNRVFHLSRYCLVKFYWSTNVKIFSSATSWTISNGLKTWVLKWSTGCTELICRFQRKPKSNYENATRFYSIEKFESVTHCALVFNWTISLINLNMILINDSYYWEQIDRKIYLCSCHLDWYLNYERDL